MRPQNSRSRFAVLFLAPLALAVACDDDDNGSGVNNPVPVFDAGGGGQIDASTGSDDASVGLSDAEIFHVMTTANTGEVAQANAALPNVSNSEVKMYAQMMISDHGSANDRGAALAAQKGITPLDNPTSQQLKSDSDAIVAQLQSLSGMALDMAYMDSQITTHTKVLSIVDTQLLPSAQDPDLKTELSTMRTTVAGHLTEAQSIRSSLADGGTDGGSDASPE